ncbi:SGNH/GDSL hydrolase family protein [Chitinophaga sp. 22321]|uniref:SGNH/GDSL hydrolase family protein n=1 Tax=Chitinophaga hostae TaxID=2831022 RepID=A0ABS5J5A4_9BACT|nr:SGNH/GDSL hydrolase family protein [Chitinophaga hostae]MBS0030397.1 SGNH/GDSL hydrolase family protein [Chitinophaga hostae]
MKHYFICCSLVIGMCMSLKTTAQSKEDIERKRLIEASQGAASPLYFDPASQEVSLVIPGSFHNAAEYTIRGGLPHFFKKVNAGKPLTIGFIGGSITQGKFCYRLQTAKYIRSLYPSVAMKAINAGVSGTGTDLGACRLQDQLLQYHPDLVFVEFAANGAYTDGMEGIIRQIRKYDPAIDICLIYTIYNGQTKIYAGGGIPENIKGLEKVAAYYNLPSIHLGMEASMLEKEGKLLWKGDSTEAAGSILFSTDGAHPLQAGGNLYAAAIARAMNGMKQVSGVVTPTIPAPLIADNWEDAGMYPPQEVATFSSGWNAVTTKGSPQQQFTGWFPYIMKATQPGAYFTCRFKGTMFGFFDIGGPEAGQLEVLVDGAPVKLAERGITGTRQLEVLDTTAASGSRLINRFNSYCNNRYRGQYEFITLPPGVHTVTIRVSAEKADKRKILGEKQLEDISGHPAKYDQTVVYIGKILLRGVPY